MNTEETKPEVIGKIKHLDRSGNLIEPPLKTTVMSEEQEKELNEAIKNFVIFVNTTIAMLPEHNKKYWADRITKAGTWQTKMRVCQSIRERYEADYIEKMKKQDPEGVLNETTKKKPRKKISKNG